MKGRRARDGLKEVHNEWRASENEREKSESGISSWLQRPPLSPSRLRARQQHHYGTLPTYARSHTCAAAPRPALVWQTHAQADGPIVTGSGEQTHRDRGHLCSSGAQMHHTCANPSLFSPSFVPKPLSSRCTEQQMATDTTEDGILMCNMLTKLSRSVPHSTTKCPTA